MKRLLVCSLGLLSISAFLAAAAPSGTQPIGVNWREILAEGSNIYSLKFSIERDERMNKPGSDLQSLLVDKKVEPVPNGTDVETFLKLLAVRLPDATFSRDPSEAQWVHVVENTLDKDPNYIMNQKLTLKFEGTLDGLLELLKKDSNGKLAKSLQGSTPGPGIGHPEAVKLDVTDCSYREIITKAVTGDYVRPPSRPPNQASRPHHELAFDGNSSWWSEGWNERNPGPNSKMIQLPRNGWKLFPVPRS